MAGVIWTIGTLALLIVLLSGNDLILRKFKPSAASRVKDRYLGDLSTFGLRLFSSALCSLPLGTYFSMYRETAVGEKGERASAKAMGHIFVPARLTAI